MNDTSYDVRFWKIESRAWAKKTTYRVHWIVSGRHFTESFTVKALADAFRSQLMTAATQGEAFDTETGRPIRFVRTSTDISFLDHACEYVAVAWNEVAAKSRVSILETLVRVLPVVTRQLPGEPDPTVLRKALWKHLNQGQHADPLDPAETRAIAWLAKASRPVSAFKDEAVVCDVLDALATNLDGTRSAPDYFSRRRRVLHRALAYAVRKKRLNVNPSAKPISPTAGHPQTRRTTRSTHARSARPRSSPPCSSPAATSALLRDRGSWRSTAACTTP